MNKQLTSNPAAPDGFWRKAASYELAQRAKNRLEMGAVYEHEAWTPVFGLYAPENGRDSSMWISYTSARNQLLQKIRKGCGELRYGFNLLIAEPGRSIEVAYGSDLAGQTVYDSYRGLGQKIKTAKDKMRRLLESPEIEPKDKVLLQESFIIITDVAERLLVRLNGMDSLGETEREQLATAFTALAALPYFEDGNDAA